MARPKKPISLLTRNDPRWRSAGRWIKVNRENNGVPLKTAAEVAGVSERQWSRYEKGETSIPRGRIPEVARAIAMPPGRLLMRAGYEDSDEDIDCETELRWMWTYLLRGDLVGAFERLFNLHDLIKGPGKALAQPVDGPTLDAFVTAVLMSHRLPRWLCADLIKHLKKRQEESVDHDGHVVQGRRSRLRRKIKEKLSKPITISKSRRNLLGGPYPDKLGGDFNYLIPPEKRSRK